MEVFGLDIGGSGIKGAPVDTATGELSAERRRIPTPESATPDEIAALCAEVVSHFGWDGPVGCGFPGVVKSGIVHTAANVSREFLGFDFRSRLSEAVGNAVKVINDADAAGLAEMRYGAGRGAGGVVLMLTLGTGIGTAIFVNGELLPNTELGHVEIRGEEAELRASYRARKREGLSWKRWAARLSEYLDTMERLLWPDLIIVGGGGSKRSEKFLPLLSTRAEIVPAQLLNTAGIVGAALAAVDE
jgi:polyphosphate glucokinase